MTILVVEDERRKVDDNEPNKLIQTVRGVGYRIGDST
jgi:DNA-binding response OmpR family regulator